MDLVYEKVISAVQEHPNLYDTSRKDHKDKEKRENSWASIAAELDITVNDVKKHWTYLRNKFSLTIRSGKRPTGSAAERKKTGGVLSNDIMRQMAFVKPFVKSRRYV